MTIMAPFAQTIDDLAARWKGTAAILPGFALLAEGTPVTQERLAVACGIDAEELQAMLNVISHGRNEQGNIIDIYGMSLLPSRHEVLFGDRRVYACCALWAHAIPRIVGRSATVRSADPVTGETVQFRVAPNAIEALYPQTAMATMAVATQADLDTDIGAAFCSQVHHFSDIHQAKRFSQDRPNCHIVDPAELNGLAEDLLTAIAAAFRNYDNRS